MLNRCIFLSQGRHYNLFPDFTPSSDAKTGVWLILSNEKFKSRLGCLLLKRAGKFQNFCNLNSMRLTLYFMFFKDFNLKCWEGDPLRSHQNMFWNENAKKQFRFPSFLSSCFRKKLTKHSHANSTKDSWMKNPV